MYILYRAVQTDRQAAVAAAAVISPTLSPCLSVIYVREYSGRSVVDLRERHN